MAAFEYFTIMIESPLIVGAAVLFLFVYAARYKNPKD
ncbi:cytochrome bd oxidase small subunit CydS [Paenibacillus jiagnxiensis]